jgi:predicted dehydrogenase
LENIVKWGVIGSGGIARRRTIPEGIVQAKHSKLISVFDINPEVNRSVANEFHAIATNTISELLNSDINAVYIASPLNMHYEHVIACAKAKKHAFCEKPLGMNLEEAEKMISVCKSEGVRLGTALMMRFLAQHQAALRFIEEGKLGTLVYARAQLSCWYPPIPGAWRQDPKTGGGGSLVDMGSHCIDLLEMFLGEIKYVSCFINNTIHAYKSEDSAIVSLFFENGAMATVDTFFCIPDNSSKNILEIYGSKGSILARGTIGQSSFGEMTAFLQEDNTEYNAQQGRTLADGIPVNPAAVNMYCAEIEEFSSAILENRIAINNESIGLRCQKILDACTRSAQSKKIAYVER